MLCVEDEPLYIRAADTRLSSFLYLDGTIIPQVRKQLELWSSSNLQQ